MCRQRGDRGDRGLGPLHTTHRAHNTAVIGPARWLLPPPSPCFAPLLTGVRNGGGRPTNHAAVGMEPPREVATALSSSVQVLEGNDSETGSRSSRQA